MKKMFTTFPEILPNDFNCKKDLTPDKISCQFDMRIENKEKQYFENYNDLKYNISKVWE